MILGDLTRRGWTWLPALDRAPCEALAAAFTRSRSLDHTLFLTEAEYLAKPQHKGVNPMPGRNWLEGRWLGVGWPSVVTAALTELLGGRYVTLDRKLVCGLPTARLPAWVRERIDVPVPNLGAYVRPEFRDATYFHGIDFHQDLIDWPGRAADFLTLYIYLTDTGPNDAPLRILEESHLLGAQMFPHDDDIARFAREVVLTGPAGSAALWHACTLHGTSPVLSDTPRLSLRYLFAKYDDRNCALDEINAEIAGPLSLAVTRCDI